jgi:hypothetical protein
MRKIAGIVLWGTAALCGSPAPRDINVVEFRVLYDGQKDGYDASAGGAVLSGKTLELVFIKASDAAAGTLPYRIVSPDLGHTWTKPHQFGTELLNRIVESPSSEFLGLSLFGPTRSGATLSIGFHTARPVREGSYRQDVRWRPGAFLVGRREKTRDGFDYKQFPTGEFLGEQFAAPGIITSKGRLLLTIWGAAKQNENWQCGVLVSDDDGRTFRYRQVGYFADPAIRDSAEMPAGFNEQTLFETKSGKIISIIRGREKLGRLPDSPKDTWFFRSSSNDAGETWSSPQPSNLAGTGAPSSGVTLPDGSLLTVSRIPYSRTLYQLPEKSRFGLHLVRSFDDGLTWKTVKMLQQSPEGNPYDNYYNAMNGQFLRLSKNEWIYLFGEFRAKEKQHRMMLLRLRYE